MGGRETLGHLSNYPGTIAFSGTAEEIMKASLEAAGRMAEAEKKKIGDRPKKLRVMFDAKDHPFFTDSGYAIALRYIVQGLRNDLDIAVFAPVGARYKKEYYFPDLGLIGTEKDFELVTEDGRSYFLDSVVPIYPGISEGWGEEIVEEHFQDFKAEVLFVMGDAWALDRIPKLAEQNRIRLVVQPAVDFIEPIPEDVLSKLRPALFVVPWTQDGIDRLRKAGLTNVYETPIPLGVNTDIWKPRRRADYPGTMDNLGFKYDSFNVSIINANQYMRKAWEQTLRGIKAFTEKHPEIPTRLYLHTFMSNSDGWNMQQLVNSVGLGDITRIPNQYDLVTGQFTESQLMLAHALADVVVNAGLEGFGLATIQAGACGTPLIGLNAGATPELLAKAVLVEPYYDFLTPNFLHKVDPHPLQIAQALEAVAIEIPREDFADNVEFVKKNFDWTVVVDKWKTFFKVLDEELRHRCIKSGEYPPAPSARELEMAARRIEVA